MTASIHRLAPRQSAPQREAFAVTSAAVLGAGRFSIASIRRDADAIMRDCSATATHARALVRMAERIAARLRGL
jgi:hypothetical protein